MVVTMTMRKKKRLTMMKVMKIDVMQASPAVLCGRPGSIAREETRVVVGGGGDIWIR